MKSIVSTCIKTAIVLFICMGGPVLVQSQELVKEASSTIMFNSNDPEIQPLLSAIKEWEQEEKDFAVIAFYALRQHSEIFDRTCMTLKIANWWRENKDTYRYSDLESLRLSFENMNVASSCYEPEKAKVFKLTEAELYLGSNRFKGLNETEKALVLRCYQQSMKELIEENLSPRVYQLAQSKVYQQLKDCAKSLFKLPS